MGVTDGSGVRTSVGTDVMFSTVGAYVGASVSPSDPLSPFEVPEDEPALPFTIASVVPTERATSASPDPKQIIIMRVELREPNALMALPVDGFAWSATRAGGTPTNELLFA